MDNQTGYANQQLTCNVKVGDFLSASIIADAITSENTFLPITAVTSAQSTASGNYNEWLYTITTSAGIFVCGANSLALSAQQGVAGAQYWVKGR
jgi:hypothetical protein